MFLRNIRDFQNAVASCLKSWKENFGTLPKALDLSYLHVNFQKVLTKNDVTVVKKRNFHFFISGNDFIMAAQMMPHIKISEFD